jgi:long-chain fatty acid transport protein
MGRADEIMITNRLTAAAVIAVWVSGLSAFNVSASGFRLAGQDAFATARGEAFVATADNASAVYYNPAGITQLEGFSFRGGAYGIYLDPTFTPPRPRNTNTFHIHDKWAAVPQGFTTYTPKNWPLSFGAGFYAPYGGEITWPQDTGFRSVAIEGALKYLTINPVVAAKLPLGFSVGGGVMVNYGDLETEQGLLASRLPTNIFRFKGDGWSVGYNLGLRWQPHEKVALGATFRSSAKVGLDGKTEFQQFPLPGLYPPTNRVASTDFEFPLTVVFGISYRPTPKWNLEFNADYTDWSSFGTSVIHMENPPRGLKAETPVTLKWKPSWMYEFGVTRYFDNGWHVSAGYIFSQNSVPDSYYYPLAADLDRHFFSIGAGYKGKRYDIDLTYQFGYGPDHKVSGSTPSSTPGRFAGQTADGKYDFLSHALMLTVGVRF